MQGILFYAGVIVAAGAAGLIVSILLDLLLFKHIIADRLAGIVLSCALTFVLMMGASTYYLTSTDPFEHGPIIVPPLPFALCYIVGLTAVAVARVTIYGRVHAAHEEEETSHDEEVLAWKERNAGRNYLLRHWAGGLSLPVSYWVNGTLLTFLVVIAAEALIRQMESSGSSLRIIAGVSLGILALTVLLWIWSSVGIWRAAYWHGRRGGSPGWGTAARILILLGALGAIGRAGNFALQANELRQLALGNDPIGKAAAMKIGRDGSELSVRGPLTEGSAARFAALVDEHPSVRTIVLTSVGGRILEGQRMADVIRGRGLDTHVDEYCMSACTFVLLGGANRTAPNRARVGFHQPSFPGLSPRELRRSIANTRQDYLDAGVSEQFVARAMVTPAENMWFPSIDELKEANVLTTEDVVVVGGGRRRLGAPPPGEEEESLSDQSLRRELLAAAADINRRAPITLDSVTKLQSASAANFTLTLNYTLAVGEIDIATSRRNIRAAVRQGACREPRTLAIVRDGGRFVYSYDDSRGKHLFDFELTDCDLAASG